MSQFGLSACPARAPAEAGCEDDEGRAVVVVGVAGGDDFAVLNPGGVGGVGAVGVFVELKFIPRFAEVTREDAAKQNTCENCEKGQPARKEIFHCTRSHTQMMERPKR